MRAAPPPQSAHGPGGVPQSQARVQIICDRLGHGMHALSQSVKGVTELWSNSMRCAYLV
jgi:hypothetical protein